MLVKELKEKLEKMDENKEIVIKFALDEEDELGYPLEPLCVYDYIGQVILCAEYTVSEEDCALFGQVDLREAYKKMLED